MSATTWEERFDIQWKPFRNVISAQLHRALTSTRDPRKSANTVWIERSGVWNTPAHQSGAWLKNLEGANSETAAAVRREITSFQFRSGETASPSLPIELPQFLSDPNVLLWGATGAVFVGTRLAGLPLPVSAATSAAMAIFGRKLINGSEPVSPEPFIAEFEALGDRIRALLRVLDTGK